MVKDRYIIIKKINKFIKEWFSIYLDVAILIFFIYAIIKGQIDDKNLNHRFKFTYGKIIETGGIDNTNLLIYYSIDNFSNTRLYKFPGGHKFHLGDSIKIKYDTLDYENINPFIDIMP